MKRVGLFIVLNSFVTLSLCTPLKSNPLDPANLKPAPVRPSNEADVITENVEVVDTCESDKICVEGQLYNRGAKPADRIKLRVEIGGTKHAKPRYVFHSNVENPSMNPGDRQDFSLTIDRKIPYKQKNEDKVLEVGKYNFKIVPTWTKQQPTKPKSKKAIGKKPRK